MSAHESQEIPFIDLAAQQARLKDRIDGAVARVLAHGQYIMGPEVREFEEKLARFCGARHALGVANGTDALRLSLMALAAAPGQAVFAPSFTFAGTAEETPTLGATPFFVDVQPDTFNMDAESLKRSIAAARAMELQPAGIIPVDLFGLPADYDNLVPIARENGMWIICDAAQSFGAIHRNQPAGMLGDVTSTSFFPAKPLGCYGDGGAIVTNSDVLAERVASLRMHGKGAHKYDNERLGTNSRLDTLQAAILIQKLEIFKEEITARQKVAERYDNGLSGHLKTPSVPTGLVSVWAQYTVTLPEGTDRDAVQQKLKTSGIPTAVYYPLPLHQQTAYRQFPRDPEGLSVSEGLSKRVLSLPMHPYLDERTQDRIIAATIDALN